MNITITGRNFNLKKEIKSYVEKRLNRLEKTYKRIFRAEVILDKEKTRENAEIILHLKRNRIVAKESTPDMYASIDKAYDSVKKQLRRLNDRVHSKRRRIVMDRILKPVSRFKRSSEEE